MACIEERHIIDQGMNEEKKRLIKKGALERIKNVLICTNSMIFPDPLEVVFMGTTRKTITVTDQQDKWIKAQIAAGHFTNDSEYVRDLIRRDQASQADIEAIRAALIEGEESGEPQLFDSSQFKQEMTVKHADKIR